MKSSTKAAVTIWLLFAVAGAWVLSGCALTGSYTSPRTGLTYTLAVRSPLDQSKRVAQ